MKSLHHWIRHFFIPHESNNFRSKLLHTDMLSLYFAFALLLTVVFRNFSGPLTNVLGIATDISVSKLFQLTNQEREKNGLTDLTYNEKLSQAAAAKARDMFAKDYWAHYGPNGETPWDFILSSGYQYEYAGENLAKNFLFSDGVVNAWMNSPTHRENVLKPEYSDVGYAVMNGSINGEETTLVVQMFGKPLSAVTIPANIQAKEHNITAPTIAPTAPPTPAHDELAGLAVKPAYASEQTPKKTVQPYMYSGNVIFLVILGIALLLDLYFSLRMKLFRVTGKNIAHLLFILFILVGMYFIAQGSVLKGITMKL